MGQDSEGGHTLQGRSTQLKAPCSLLLPLFTKCTALGESLTLSVHQGLSLQSGKKNNTRTGTKKMPHDGLPGDTAADIARARE